MGEEITNEKILEVSAINGVHRILCIGLSDDSETGWDAVNLAGCGDVLCDIYMALEREKEVGIADLYGAFDRGA